jgi:predicted RNA-binding protein associated with RNAse of E/G family
VNRRITVHKLDASGREVWAYEGRVLSQDGPELVLEARFDRDDLDLAGLRLRRGDRFVETFYTDRGYNVFAVYASEAGRLKGWYCNITRPACIDTEGGDIRAEDLALDVIVLPDGRSVVLDEDEFAALPLSDAERHQARRALADLRAAILRRQGPFAAINPSEASLA